MADVIEPDAAKKAKEYLINHGIKQSFVAYKMGVSKQNVNDHLSGRLKFTADFAFRFAKVLDISPDIFLSKSYSK